MTESKHFMKNSDGFVYSGDHPHPFQSGWLVSDAGTSQY